VRSQVDHLRPSRRTALPIRVPLALAAAGVLVLAAAAQPAFAIGTTVGLGTAGSYSVLGGETVENTGPSVLSSNVGVSPGSAIIGFPPGSTGGVVHTNDAHAAQAQSDLTTAYNNAAGQASDATVGSELGGLTLAPGVYTVASSAEITGPLTLDAGGDPGAVFIFQIGSTLVTGSSSSVVMLNDAQSCHVFWQVAESATLGTGSSFVGTIMALTSITANTGATVEGRALARNGAVTLDTNVFTDVSCATTSTTPPTSAAPSPTATGTGTPTGTASTTSSPTTPPPGSTTATTPTNTAVVSPTDTSSSASNETASVAAVGSGESNSGEGSGTGPLAYTGAGSVGPLIALASGAVLAGLVVILVARRRRSI